MINNLIKILLNLQIFEQFHNIAIKEHSSFQWIYSELTQMFIKLK